MRIGLCSDLESNTELRMNLHACKAAVLAFAMHNQCRKEQYEFQPNL